MLWLALNSWLEQEREEEVGMRNTSQGASNEKNETHQVRQRMLNGAMIWGDISNFHHMKLFQKHIHELSGHGVR